MNTKTVGAGEHSPAREVTGGRSRRRGLRAALAALCLALNGTAAGQALPTEPGSHGGLFVVDDPFGQFIFMKHHGEALAWRNNEASGAPDPDIYDHYQGLSRYPGPVSRPVFYVSQSATDGGYLTVVRFGSRGSDGERLRSNLQQVGNDTEEDYPPTSDAWQRSIRLDGSFSAGGVTLPAYYHPGGSAVIDGYLLVPADQPIDDASPTGVIIVFDLSNPLDPEPVRFQPLTHGIDNLAVTRRADGSYLIWTNGDGGEDINVYTTAPGADLGTDPMVLDHVWSDALHLTGQSWPTGTGAHQSGAFLRTPAGGLYFMGMRHPGGSPFSGSDYADLYLVDDSPPAALQLTYLGEKHLYCVYDGGGGPVDMRICNLAAASGVYVSPSGELILYAMPHDDEDGFSPDIARMGEFRHRDVLRPTNPLLSSQPDANGPYFVDEGGQVQLFASVPATSVPWFVELYDDNTYNDRSIVVDWQDRDLLELNNFNNLDGFNDKASSVRWRLPLGVTAYLRENDNYGGDILALTADGNLRSIANLDDFGFGDKTSSLQLFGAPIEGPPLVEWDLDSDGVYGETGASARFGDETGTNPVFDAATLNGPNVLPVRLRVTPTASAPLLDSSEVTSLNVAPGLTLTASTTFDPAPGGVIQLRVDVTDAFVDERIDLDIDWGDGTPLEKPNLGTARLYQTQHQYTADFPAGVTITVTAYDDESSTTRTARLALGPDLIFEESFENAP